MVSVPMTVVISPFSGDRMGSGIHAAPEKLIQKITATPRMTEHKEVPVITASLAWIANKRVAGKKRTEQGQADRPAWQSASGRHEFTRRLAAFREPAPESDDASQVTKQHKTIDDRLHENQVSQKSIGFQPKSRSPRKSSSPLRGGHVAPGCAAFETLHCFVCS